MLTPSRLYGVNAKMHIWLKWRFGIFTKDLQYLSSDGIMQTIGGLVDDRIITVIPCKDKRDRGDVGRSQVLYVWFSIYGTFPKDVKSSHELGGNRHVVGGAGATGKQEAWGTFFQNSIVHPMNVRSRIRFNTRQQQALSDLSVQTRSIYRSTDYGTCK